mgnify:CR=1 FL=1
MIEELIKKTKAYQDLEQQVTRLRNQLGAAESFNKRLESESKILSDRLGDITDKLTTVSLARTHSMNTPHYRICVDVDRDMIEREFMHGSDHELIHMMGKRIGAQVSREIALMNNRR